MRSRIFGAAVALTLGALACAGGASGTTIDADLTMADLPVKTRTPWEPGVFTQTIDHGTDGNTPFAAPLPQTTADADAGVVDPLPLETDADGGATAADGGAAPAPTTYAQRYWVNRSYSLGPNAPVLFYLCGESECAASYGNALLDSARVLGASIVVLEHRFYGESVPFGTPTVEQFRYLTIHNALEDAATFERHAKESLGLGGKWIVAGGSYPGTLAAFYRLKHPELVVGAWASSAPLNLTTSFPGYDALAARTLGPSCSLLVRQAEASAAARLADPARRGELVRRVYQAEALPDWADEVTAEDIQDYIASSADEAAQYGTGSVLCSSLLQHEEDPLEGYLAFRTPILAADPLAIDAGAAVTIADAGVSATAADAGVDAHLTPGGSHPAPAMPAFVRRRGTAPGTVDEGYAWSYQTCAEFACYQVHNPDRTESVAPVSTTEATFVDGCREQFGVLPNVEGIRATYTAPILAGQATNILFVNGDRDPWSAISLTDPAAAPPGVEVFVVRGGSHCDDLDNLYPGLSAGVFEAHKKFADLARKWLAD